MRKHALLSVVVFLGVVLPTWSFASVADAPHNETNDIACSDCHDYSLWWQYSPSINNAVQSHDQIVSDVCLSCHGPESPLEEKTHSSDTMGSTSFDFWSRNCVECHDPHIQAQLHWLNDDPAWAEQLYLVTGTIELGTIDYNAAQNTTLFSYNSANATKTDWLDPVIWNSKSESDRGLILVVSAESQESSFEINSATGEPITAGMADGNGTITVQGQINSSLDGANFGLIYGQLIKTTVNQLPVKFFGPFDPDYSFVDNTGQTNEGLCQVCHSLTKYYNPTANDHFSQPCTDCHSHKIGFAHYNGGLSSPSCSTTSCHNTDKHSNHLDMTITCEDCHDLAALRDQADDVIFDDGELLAQTTVCIVCHQNGAGGGLANQTDYKTGWTSAVYDLDCSGCHSFGPNYSNGVPKANSHSVHANYTCNFCHNLTTSDGVSITNGQNHPNQSYTLAAGGGASFTYTYDAAGGSCATISCHGNAGATWGNPLSVDCSS